MIGKIIKHNKALQHLDLTSTSLTSIQVEEIGNSLRKARSLLCIHLSGNHKAVHDPVMKTSLVTRIKTRQPEDMERFVNIRDKFKSIVKDLPPNMLDGIKSKVEKELDMRV